MPLAWAVAGSAILSAGIGIYEGQAQQHLGRQAINASNPFGPNRAYYAGQLNNLMANPSSVTSMPGYNFNLQQGAGAVATSGAANEYLGSGNLATALQSFGTNYAQSTFNQYAQLYAMLSGATSGPPQATAAGLSSVGAGVNTIGSGLGSVGYTAALMSVLNNQNNQQYPGTYSGSGVGPLVAPNSYDSAGTYYPGGGAPPLSAGGGVYSSLGGGFG